MKLLCTKRSPYARKVRILAIEKKIDLELMEEDLVNKSARLIEANPLGKIPALILDDGQCLVDSPVICEYLDDLKEAPVLIPKIKEDCLKIKHLEAMADGLMDVTVALYLEKTRHPNDLNEQFIKTQEATIARTLKFFDKNAAELSRLTLASIAIASALGYMQFRLPHLFIRENYSALSKWFDDFSKRPSMTQTMPG